MVAIIASLLASYMGAQPKIARGTVRKNRRHEMDRQATGAYVAALPEAQQHKLRTRSADRFFVEDGAAVAVTSAVALLTDPEVIAAAKRVTKAALLTAIKGRVSRRRYRLAR